jgi:hypothetical protein
MNLFYASALAYCINELAVIECTCNMLIGEGRGAMPPPTEIGTQLLRVLGACLSACTNSGLPECIERVKATTHRLHKQNVNVSIIANGANTLKEEIVTALEKRRFLRVLEDRTAYVDGENLFGVDVGIAFQSARQDIKEAGNCLAVECNTAAVFHLMRAAEFAVRALAVDRSVTFARKDIQDAQWGEILNQLEPKLNALRQADRNCWPSANIRDKQIIFYNEVIQELRGFNDAWRRHVSHADPMAFYDRDTALGIFKHVQRFMGKISAKISESSQTSEYWGTL